MRLQAASPGLARRWLHSGLECGRFIPGRVATLVSPATTQPVSRRTWTTLPFDVLKDPCGAMSRSLEIPVLISVSGTGFV